MKINNTFKFIIRGRPRVFVAMSGGIDSSVAAALLKKQGFDVVGVFMKFWLARRSIGEGGKGFNRCCSPDSERRARQVAKILKIPFYVFNFEKEFKKRVVDYFIKGYKEGITPNPCVVCNKEIKFGLLLEKALKLEADYIATGHYARIPFLEKQNNFSRREKFFSILGLAPRLRRVHGRSSSEEFSLKDILAFRLFQGKDTEKDQSYFLWKLNQEKLKRILFPIGNYTKPEVRKLAAQFKLPFKKIPESMEICFVPGKLEDFLKKYIKTKPGPIITAEGKIIGRHQGLPFYTIGQRKGIELSGLARRSLGEGGRPYYVVGKDKKRNALIAASILKDAALWKKELIAKNVNWISGKEPRLPLRVKAQIRYHHPLVPAVISKALNPETYTLKFQNPQRAVTPGQSVVFYKSKELLGGGIIS